MNSLSPFTRYNSMARSFMTACRETASVLFVCWYSDRARLAFSRKFMPSLLYAVNAINAVLLQGGLRGRNNRVNRVNGVPPLRWLLLVFRFACSFHVGEPV